VKMSRRIGTAYPGVFYREAKRIGGPRKEKVYYILFKKDGKLYEEKAGLPKDFRPLHGLRHVYASMLASSGKVDMYTLQRLLTHKSPLMTQRYAHLRDEALKKAANLAGEMIQDAIKKKEKVSELQE
jgi:integrase